MILTSFPVCISYSNGMSYLQLSRGVQVHCAGISNGLHRRTIHGVVGIILAGTISGHYATTIFGDYNRKVLVVKHSTDY